HSEYRFVARDGRVVWVRGEARVARDDAGRPLFLQGIAFDITAMKQAEAALKAYNQTLEQRGKERTQAVEDKAQELERSNRALEQFNFFVAHEVRKPIPHILESAQNLAGPLQGKRAVEARESLQGIVRKVQDMDLMINRMLQYARFGGSKVAFRPTDCAAV